MSSETGVRLKTWPPSASAMAEVMADAPEPSTGSPTPFTPTGFCGSIPYLATRADHLHHRSDGDTACATANACPFFGAGQLPFLNRCLLAARRSKFSRLQDPCTRPSLSH